METFHGHNCSFPFLYGGKYRFDCVLPDQKTSKCAIHVDGDFNPVEWSFCLWDERKGKGMVSGMRTLGGPFVPLCLKQQLFSFFLLTAPDAGPSSPRLLATCSRLLRRHIRPLASVCTSDLS